MTDEVAALRRARILPVLTIHEPADVDPIADGLIGGGICAVEVTLRTPHGLTAIRRLADRGDLVVGAGTVLSGADVEAAVDAGAVFTVSPGLNEAVVSVARARGVVPLPGIATATELQRACALGLRHVKVFPIEAIGGMRMLEALHLPFPDVEFMPSGGVTPSTAAQYLALPSVFAVGGSWLVPGTKVPDLAAAVHDRARAALGDLEALDV